MLQYPQIDPVAISLGPLNVHWYGLMYLVGLGGGWWLATRRARRPGAVMNEQQVGDLVFWVALGVILGGRLGYVLFYNFDQFLQQPLSLFAVWEGGMAFHGGLIGVILAMLLFARKPGLRANCSMARMTRPEQPTSVLQTRSHLLCLLMLPTSTLP